MHSIIFLILPIFFFAEFVLPQYDKPVSEWQNNLHVTCEWGNVWSHNLIHGCIDPKYAVLKINKF